MANAFVSIMEKIGADIKIAWDDVVKYLPPVEALASLIFPQAKALPGVINSINLIQQAVATVEQKFAAMGAATGSGAEKLAHVVTLVGPTVNQLLTAEGLHYDSAQVTSIINAVVAVLNAQPAPAAA